MRDLLFLAHRIPYPPNKGDKIRSFHVLRQLASRFKIHLGCFSDNMIEERAAAELRKFCADVFCVPAHRSRIPIALIGAVTSGRSITESFYRDRRMAHWVDKTLRENEIKDVFVFCSAMAPYMLPRRAGRRVVVDMVDADSKKWGCYADLTRGILRPVFRLEQRRVFSLEKAAAAASGHTLFVSRAEAEGFSALAPELAARIRTMSNGVDFEYFDPANVFENPFAADALPIVFTGAMNYRANVDAVSWFARECFPAVRRTYLNAQFWIVGADPSRMVRRLASESRVQVTGEVADVRPYLAHAACAVAPLRIARGIQNKVLEAMAMGKPIVATSGAIEGIEAQNGRQVLVADKPREFADCVCKIFSGTHTRLGPAAREFVKKFHRWEENLRLLDEIFAEPRMEQSATSILHKTPAGVA